MKFSIVLQQSVDDGIVLLVACVGLAWPGTQLSTVYLFLKNQYIVGLLLKLSLPLLLQILHLFLMDLIQFLYLSMVVLFDFCHLSLVLLPQFQHLSFRRPVQTKWAVILWGFATFWSRQDINLLILLIALFLLDEAGEVLLKVHQNPFVTAQFGLHGLDGREKSSGWLNIHFSLAVNYYYYNYPVSSTVDFLKK